MCLPELALIIVQLHILAASDSTSAFFGRGKKAIVKNVLKNIEGAKLLPDDFDQSLTMPEGVYKKIILFVLKERDSAMFKLLLTLYTYLCVQW